MPTMLSLTFQLLVWTQDCAQQPCSVPVATQNPTAIQFEIERPTDPQSSKSATQIIELSNPEFTHALITARAVHPAPETGLPDYYQFQIEFLDAMGLPAGALCSFVPRMDWGTLPPMACASMTSTRARVGVTLIHQAVSTPNAAEFRAL
jgi:hypothetical protein